VRSTSDIGALARIGTDEVLAALGLARSGRVYDLGLEINEQMPQGARGVFVPFSRAFSATPEGTGSSQPFSFAAEVIIGTQHTSTHIDAFIHVQYEGRVYGGRQATEVRTDQGWLAHGMETVPPIIARCILLDVAGIKGVDALNDGYEITIDDLSAAREASSVELRSGDVVLVRTGKIREFLSDPDAYEAAQPGVGAAAAVWLHEQGMAVLGTDTTSTEPLPIRDAKKTTHQAMLVERGVHLLESVFLDELARDRVGEAAFVCLPLKLTGATGSWIRPVAMT
jgi:kynurenine formamidase